MMQDKLYPIILSGGLGERLWPVSQQNRPKQFLMLQEQTTMLAQTIERFAQEQFHPITCVCSEEQRFLVKDQFAQNQANPRAILLEPSRKDTAAAIALAALSVIESDGDGILVIAPSDHKISKCEHFYQALNLAVDSAKKGYIVTFGCVADLPHTGYGYIEQGQMFEDQNGVYAIKKFHEKPSQTQAQKYLAQGNFYWNSGMFVARATMVRDSFLKHANDIWKAQEKAYASKRQDLGFVKFLEEDYQSIPVASFDHAIMENIDHGLLVPIDIGWSDVGSWYQVWSMHAKDEHNNVAIGEHALSSSVNSFIYNEDADVVAVHGVSNIMVVASDNKVLVIDKDQSESVKSIVHSFIKQNKTHLFQNKKTYRPWGSYQELDVGGGYLIKKLIINPKQKLSLQYHHHRSEHWVIVSGTAHITLDDKSFDAHINESFFVPKNSVHRLENNKDEPLVIIEVQTGQILDESDIVRLEDIYQRDQ